MIVTLEGVMGSGKSMFAATASYWEFSNGKQIISNMHLNFPYTHLDTDYFVEHMGDAQLQDSVIIFDEAYVYLDSRNSATKLNKLFTYFVVQTRKRGVDLYVCIHHIDTVDKRLRRAIDVRGTCRYRKELPCRRCKGEKEYKGAVCDNCLGYGEAGRLSVSFLDLRTGRRAPPIRIHAPSVWHLYDTRELVPLTGKQLTIDQEDL